MENMVSSTDKESMVSSFLEVTVNQTVDIAHHFLQATNWRLEDAMQLFYEGTKGRNEASSSNVPPVQYSAASGDHNCSDLAEGRRNVTQLATATATPAAGPSLPPTELLACLGSKSVLSVHGSHDLVRRRHKVARISQLLPSPITPAPAFPVLSAPKSTKRPRGRPRSSSFAAPATSSKGVSLTSVPVAASASTPNADPCASV